MKNWSELSREQKIDSEQRRFDGEFDRRRLIRFGYLSVLERRRLREKYHDLDDRFEPESHYTPEEYAIGVFIVFMCGYFLGASLFAEDADMDLIALALAAGLYWLCAAFVLRCINKETLERNQLYNGWRHDE